MFRTILLAYNGSEHSNAALAQAVDIARTHGAQLHMLGIAVNTGGMVIAQSTGSLDVIELERERIQHTLEAAAHKLRDDGMNVIFSVRQGEPAAQILAYAQKISADLVVLGNTNKGIIARWLQTSLGEKLLNNLPCSLLIVTTERRA